MSTPVTPNSPNLSPNRSRADGRLPELQNRHYRISTAYRPGSASVKFFERVVRVRQVTRRVAVVVLLVFVCGIIWTISPTVSGDSGLVEPANSEKTTSLSERLKKRKNELKLSLGESTKQRLAAKCTTSQAVVGKLKDRDGTVREKYHSVYTKLVERLETITTKLSRQGQSTATLANAQQLLVDAVNQYLTDAEAYRAAANDLAKMDCDGDLEGFQATLVTARSLREKLAADASAIKQAAADVRVTLAQAKTTLQNIPTPTSEASRGF